MKPYHSAVHSPNNVHTPFLTQLGTNTSSVCTLRSKNVTAGLTENNHSKFRETLNNTNTESRYFSIKQLLKPNTSQVITINTPYINNDMTQAVNMFDYLLVKSDMKSGKTYGMANAIVSSLACGVVIVVTHLRSLVRGNKERIAKLLKINGHKVRIAHYEDDKAMDIEDSQLVFTTLHSLHNVIAKLGGANRVSAVFFDESESVAQIMTAEIMDKLREKVSLALDDLAKIGCKLIMLDAHLGASTYAFCNAYFHGKEWVLLQNCFTPWEHNTYQWIVKGGFDGNAEKAGLTKLVELILMGKRVFVTSGSKAQAQRIYNALKKLGLTHNNVLKAWGDSPELQECKDDHDKFNDYPLVIATPAVGTGISIEPRKGIPSFDCVVSFIVRHKEAPDPVSAMQMPFRVRQTTDHKIWLVACNFQPESTNGLPEFVIQRDVKRQLELFAALQNDFPETAENNNVRALVFGTYAGFAGAIALNKAAMWGDFFGVINDEFNQKGITQTPNLTINEDDEVIDADKEARAEAKEYEVVEKFEAIDFTPTQAAAVELKAKHSNKLSKDDRLALEKYKLIHNYAPHDYNPSDLNSFKKLLSLRKRGYMSGCNHVANAQLSLKDINKVRRAWTVEGQRQKDATSLDAQKIKNEWMLDRILCDLIKLKCINGVYVLDTNPIARKELTTKEKGGRGSYVRLISELIDDWNATHTDQRLNRKLLQDDPLTFISKLLSNRLKLRVKVKMTEGVIEISDTQPTIDLLNKHTKRGLVGLAKLIEAIDTELIEEIPVINQPITPKPQKNAIELLKQAWYECGMPCSFNELLTMFSPYKADIEAENGYGLRELILAIKANFYAAA